MTDTATPVIIVGAGISAIQLYDEFSLVTTSVTRRPPEFHRALDHPSLLRTGSHHTAVS